MSRFNGQEYVNLDIFLSTIFYTRYKKFKFHIFKALKEKFHKCGIDIRNLESVYVIAKIKFNLIH